MTSTNRPIQSFQAYYEHPNLTPVNDTIIPLQPRHDKKNNQLIILWRDIQNVFENAKYIRDDDAVISFEIDDNFEEIKPERILYQPGIILKVIVSGQPAYQDSNAATIALESEASISEATINALDITELSLVPHSSGPSPQGQVTGITMHKVYQSFVTQQEFIKGTMQEVCAQQREIIQLQTQIGQKVDDTNQITRMTFDLVADIRNSVQAVFTQTYELHEYPIPRLFIVLPTASRFRDKFGKPFSHQFRLYFLCECGQHTMREGSMLQHNIHLAKHEGYELDQPTEFFEKYGPYLLTMMRMVKFGFTAAGIFVPPLAQLKIGEGIEYIHAGVDIAKNTIGSLVDETIIYIENKNTMAENGVDMAEDQTELDSLEVLEGADLRQLESYLKMQDQSRTLGNLYRTVTEQGHVKWVCIDHYRENYREAVMERVKELVEVLGGEFFPEESRIKINIPTKTQAKLFYDAIVKARGIQELEVSLGWDATMADLRKFTETLSKANIVSLIMDGSRFYGPPLDLANYGRRYNPILELMSNGRIRSMTIKNFEDFFQHISNSALTMVTQIKYLSISVGSIFIGDGWPILKRLLGQCPALVELVLDGFYVNVGITLDGLLGDGKNVKLKNLKMLRLEQDSCQITAEYSHGQIKSMAMRVDDLRVVIRDYPSYLKDQLTMIEFWNPVKTTDYEHLANILEANPKLFQIQIGYGSEAGPMIMMIASKRQELLEAGRPCALREVLFPHFDENVKDNLYDKMISVEFPDAKDPFNMSVSIDMRNFTTKGFSTHLSGLFDLLGPYITSLKADSTLDDTLAAILDSKSEQEGSSLTWLSCDLESLTSAGIEAMIRFINRSADLTYFGVNSRNLDDENERSLVQELISQHGSRINAAILAGNPMEMWISDIARACPTRHYLSQMETFGLTYKDDFPSDYVQWLCTMFSAPKQAQLTLASSPAEHELKSSSGVTPSMTWRPLIRISLLEMKFQSEEWQTIMKAIDFACMEFLNFGMTNFSLEEFSILVDCILACDILTIPLRLLDLRETQLTLCTDILRIQEQFSRLKAKAMHLRVEGLPKLD